MCCEGSVDHVIELVLLLTVQGAGKVMEKTPQKVLETPGKPPAMFRSDPGFIADEMR